MAREVERGSRGKSGAVSGDGGDRNRPSANPSRRREGSFVAANPFMPGLRVREDGWTAARTRRFLAVLAQSGCVSDAARVAGMSRKSVNDARRRFPEFDRACSTALARARRGLQAVAYERAVVGREMVIVRGGTALERRRMPADHRLGLVLS